MTAKVKLVNYTSDAKNLLLFTKNTRLFDHDDSFDEIKNWSDEKKQEELDYMLKTTWQCFWNDRDMFNVKKRQITNAKENVLFSRRFSLNNDSNQEINFILLVKCPLLDMNISLE